MITLQHTQEELSRAYITAAGGRAGLIVNLKGRSQDYKVDGSLHEVQFINGIRGESGFPLDFQMKASTVWTCRNGMIVYKLDAATYDFLAGRAASKGATPIILILMCLPKNEHSWTCFKEHRVQLRRCCYWTRITGSAKGNRSTVTIRIPKGNLVTPEVLRDLIEKVRRGDTL